MTAGPSSPASPKRRWFLKAALAVTAAGTALGGGIWWNRGLDGAHLTAHGRDVFAALARAIVGPVLPKDPARRAAILDQYVVQLESLLQNLPSAKRDQISLLIGMLSNAPTRYLSTGMWTSWADATDEQVLAALEEMRSADNMVKNTAYAAARGITCLAFFSMPDHWAQTGYPGPLTI